MHHHQPGQIGDHVVRVVEVGHKLDPVRTVVVVQVRVHRVVILRLVQSMDDGQIGDHVVLVVEEGHRLDLVLIHHLQMVEQLVLVRIHKVVVPILLVLLLQILRE